MQNFLIGQICDIEKINSNGLQTLRNDIQRIKIDVIKVDKVLEFL